MSIFIILLGTLMVYFGAKMKFIKGFEGKTASQAANELAGTEVNKVVKTGLSMGLRMYSKIMLIVMGVIFIICGLLFL